MAKSTPAVSLKPKRPRPKNMTPAVAQAVLEDAVLEAAADIAALTATLDATVQPAAVAGFNVLVAETPEEASILELLGVPHLGPTRVQALADAGIRTLADLHSATPVEIGSVKGVGMRNAVRIKEWLADQPAPAPPLPSPLNAIMPAHVPASFDPALASANQELQDLFAQIDSAEHRLKSLLSTRRDARRVSRQLDRFDNLASELAEGPDTLTPKQLAQALKTLEKVAALLESVAAQGKLSLKKQDALVETLKQRRKSLKKTLNA